MTRRYSQRRRVCRAEARGKRPAAKVRCVFLAKAHERLRGLLFRKPDARVFVLVPCGAVHTFGMAHEIDIAFLDGEGTVLAVHRRVGRGRRLRCAGARLTLERFADERPWYAVGDRVGLESIPIERHEREEDL